MAPVLFGSSLSSSTLHSRSVKYFFSSWLGMFLSPGLQQPLKTNSRSISAHHCLMADSLASSCSSSSEILSLVSSDRQLSFWYLMNARQRCSKSCGTRQRTKLVKLQEPQRLLSSSSNSLPLRSQMSSRSQSSWQMSWRLSSLMRSSSARMSARITVLFLPLDSGHSSKVKRETSTLLLLTECRRSALVILVELAPAAAADLPLGVMNFSSLSSSKQGPFFFRLREEKQILVCCLYLLGLGEMLNHCLKAQQSQDSGNRLAISSKKSSFLRSPLIRYRFFISWTVTTSSALSCSKRSTRFLYCMATVFLKVSASSRFWISSSSSWQNFFLRWYSNSLPLSGISPSSLRNWQNSSKRSCPLTPHLPRKSATPRAIS